MDFLTNLFLNHTTAQAVVVLAIAIFTGLVFGRIKFLGVRLGVGGVLFSGIALGHLGFGIDGHILHYARELGLILFVFAVGMKVGPTFFDSFRKTGALYNFLATMVVALGATMTVLCLKIFSLQPDVAVGLFCGSVTNTPALSAAAQMFAELLGKSEALESIRTADMGYAVAYPFGIVGLISAMLLLKILFKVDIDQEAHLLDIERRALHPDLIAHSLECTNPALYGRVLRDIDEFQALPMTISCYKESVTRGKVEQATADLVLKEGMLLLCVADRFTMEKMCRLVGRESDIHMLTDDGLQSKVVHVTESSVIGKSFVELGFVPERGIKVTRLRRRGDVMLANESTRLHFADRIRIVADAENMSRAEKIVGNKKESLEHPQIISLFFGIFAGVLLGSIPIFIPGLAAPLKVGLAGGPLIVSILLARKHRLLGMTFYMTPSANMMVSEIGIALFLACVGINVGGGFVETLFNGPGLYWMGIAALITVVPVLIVAFIGLVFSKIRYGTLCGILSGSMTDPPALAFASQMLGTDAAVTSYATVYPLTMFLRILAGQLLVLLCVM